MAAITISAVLANYNDAQTVGVALEAILQQSHPPCEVIVIDDASTDNSMEVIGSFARRSPLIRVMRNRSNRGVIASCNSGFRAATGDYIYSASSNDKALPGFFESCALILGRHPEAGLCHVDIAVKDGRFKRMGLSKQPTYFSSSRLQAAFAKARGITAGGGNSIFKRSALAAAGYYIEDLKWNCDVFAATAVCAREGAAYIPEPLVSFNTDNNSYSAKGRRSLRAQRASFRRMIALLKTAEYRDVFEWIKTSGVWPMLDWAMLPFFFRDTELRHVISVSLVVRMLYQGFRSRAAARVPSGVKRLLGEGPRSGRLTDHQRSCAQIP